MLGGGGKKQSRQAAQTTWDEGTEPELAPHSVHSTNPGLTTGQGFQGHAIKDAWGMHTLPGAMQITIHSFSWARPSPHNERLMLLSHTAQHDTASMPEQHLAPSPANHSFPGSRPAMGSQQRPEILPRSKSNQVLPRGYVLTAKIVQTWSLSALQCLTVYSKSPRQLG